MSVPEIRLLPRSNIAGSAGSWFTPHDIAFHIMFAAVVVACWFDLRCGSDRDIGNWVRRRDGCQRFIGTKSRLNRRALKSL